MQPAIRLCLKSLAVAALLALVAPGARGNCSLKTTGLVPLPDMGTQTYQGFAGGLYPNGTNNPPPEHAAAGLGQAAQVVPLNATGQPDAAAGKIVFISIGMSSATDEFGSGGENAFKPQADADPSKNPQLTIVDGAQGGHDAEDWANPDDSAWTTLAQRLSDAGVSAAQVQVVWLKEALKHPVDDGAFPAHAQLLQAHLETILRMAKERYPNIRLAYLTSRSRAYTEAQASLNPEPYAYETGFAVRWTIADQINGTGNLNFDESKGPVVAPYLSWGPYIWVDGVNPRSDGLTWLCRDLKTDFIHPSSSGVEKVADQLLAFFKTDPTARVWFLKKASATPPSVTVSPTANDGPPGVAVQFAASANSQGDPIKSYSWTFDDGTFSIAPNPTKTFFTAGSYDVHLTVTTASGDNVSTTVPMTIGVQTAGLLNVSARLQIGVGDHVAISGFIVEGNGAKRVILRAVGPSLTQAGVAGALADPALELHDATGAVIGSNDNWETTQFGGVVSEDQVAAIRATTIAPTDPAESALIAELGPGAYTAVVHGTNNLTGVGLAEVYDLDLVAPAKVTNLSTRGFVQTGTNVLIGGLILGGADPSEVVVRGIGPSLAGVGVSGALLDPTLELRDANGALLAANDNWADTQENAIRVSGLAPADPREAAIESTLAPGSYTATLAGKDGSAGIGLVEAYQIQ